MSEVEKLHMWVPGSVSERVPPNLVSCMFFLLFCFVLIIITGTILNKKVKTKKKDIQHVLPWPAYPIAVCIPIESLILRDIIKMKLSSVLEPAFSKLVQAWSSSYHICSC